MPKLSHAFIACLLAGSAACALGAEDSLPRLTGRVIHAIDGDTINVHLHTGPITVRLGGVDAPERDQPYGIAALNALTALVAGKAVELQVVSQDRYSRLVAVVFVSGENTSAALVRAGHAWAYRQYLEDKELCYLEDAARRLRLGLWASATQRPIAPWEWRARRRGNRTEFRDFTAETARDCLASAKEARRSHPLAPPERRPGVTLLLGAHLYMTTASPCSSDSCLDLRL